MGFSYYDDDSGYLPLTGGTLNGPLTIGGTNFLTIGGTDFALGINDTSRGNTGNSRALVKGVGATLIINYAGDFSGGVKVQSDLNVSGNDNYIGTIRSVTFGGINYIESYNAYKGSGSQPLAFRGANGEAVEVTTGHNTLDDGNGNAQFTAIYPSGQPFTSPAYLVPEYLGGNVGIRGLASGAIVKWVSSSVQIRNSADSAYAPIDASAFTVNSEATNKSAILPLGSMLQEFEKLQFVEYLYQGMTEKMLGLEYAQTFAAGITSILTNTTYSKGVNVSSLIALVGKALQEVVTELKTKGVLS